MTAPMHTAHGIVLPRFVSCPQNDRNGASLNDYEWAATIHSTLSFDQLHPGQPLAQRSAAQHVLRSAARLM